jgi:hypothetical protein
MRNRNSHTLAIVLSLVLTAAFSHAAGAVEYEAGAAKICITPAKGLLLVGYPHFRTHRPAEGTLHDLWAKALALQDSTGKRVVIVTFDLNGIPRAVADGLAARIQKKFGLQRSALVLNASHTHSAPVLESNAVFNPRVIYDASPEEVERIHEYTATFADNIETVVGSALHDLAPARLSFGNGRATFAVNRRLKGADGAIAMLPNPNGPTDPDVPVLRVTSPEGKLRAVLFGYACHPVTLVDRGKPVPGYMFQYSGDYAGLAQAEVEKLNPGAIALFMQLCAGDQNPATRGDPTVSARYGAVLAAEVNRVLQGKLRPVLGNLRTTYQLVDLKLRPDTRQLFEDRLKDESPIKGPIIVRHAKAMLRAYDEGRIETTYPYPVQGIAWDRDLCLIAMGGEVVVEYALRLKKQFGHDGLIVAGYSNDVMAYIPTRQMLSEGGHEVDYSMVVYCHPGPWETTVEDRVFEAATGVLRALGRAPRK